MSLYDNEENAIVNNPDQVSETPANLVNNNVDNLVSAEELQEILQYKKDGNTNESKLSPNPAGFGFTKQEFVDSLPSVSNAQPNTLYIVKVKNDGVVIGYRLYKFVPFGNGEDAHFITFGATPDLKLVDSPREQKAVEVNEPKRSPAKVFNGDVAVNGDLFVGGKKIEADTSEEEKDLEDLKLINFKAPDGYVWTTVTTTSFDTLKEYEGQFISLRPNTTTTPIRCYVKQCYKSTNQPYQYRIVLVGVDSDSGKFYNENATGRITNAWLPIKVIANPTLSGNENALTGLQVGGTKYAVSGGTKLYLHHLVGENTIDIISNINTPLNYYSVQGDNVIAQSSSGLTTGFYACQFFKAGFSGKNVYMKVLSMGLYFYDLGNNMTSLSVEGSYTDTVTPL